MSELPVVVLDPGHGGPRGTHNGGSSWNRAEGPNGLLEKNLTFDLALRVAARLRDHARVELTRTEQANPSLAERAAVARRLDASLFLSLHLNGAADPEVDGTDVYVAHDAGAPARAFGDVVLRRLRAVTDASHGGLGVRDLGTLVTARHSPRTAACLAEIAYLTNPRQARAFAEEAYRNRIADGLSEAIREHLAAPRALVQELAFGDGSPFVSEAVTQCWERCEQFRLAASNATNPNRVAAQRIRTETGVAVDANPYFGIGRNEIEAVIRAGFTSHAMPEVLLAIWAKEGSTRSVTAPIAIPQATTDANARSIFRSKVFYEDLGADHFLVTTRAGSGADNVFDDGDAAAPGHETHFAARVAQLVTDRFLSENIAGAINTELTVSRVNGRRAVQPSMRFYALSLLLVDALWAKFQAATRPLLPIISDAMNYLQWNMGAASFDAFLRSAETHRQEPAHRVNGQPSSIEQWALHTIPKSNEYKQPRVNAVKLLHSIESYRPIFANALNLIKPGIEDLRPRGGTRTAEAAEIEVEALSVRTYPTHLHTAPRAWVRMPIARDEFSVSGGGPIVYGAATMTTPHDATETQARANLPPSIDVPDDPDRPTRFFEVPTVDAMFGSGLFRSVGGNIEAALDSVICYPCNAANPNRLAENRDRFPVAIVVHGNHGVGAWSATPTRPSTRMLAGRPVFPAINPTVARPVHNHLGYCREGRQGRGTPYLLEELAKYGFVTMSISTNGANLLDLLVTMRAEYILKYLDQLRRFAGTPGDRFHDKLDFNRVALIGHSRGGDAVVTAAHLNAPRPDATRYRFRSIVSIAPTDITGYLVQNQRRAVEIRDVGHYLVVYGSHDGDVTGSGNGAHEVTASGFRLYDRSNTHRAMVFIHRANHNGFNREWNDDGVSGELGRAVQETLAKEYVAGWLRYSMLGHWDQADLFRGTNPNSRSIPVSLMWKFGRDLKTIERYQDNAETTNTLTGRVAKPAYLTEVSIDNCNPPDPPAPPRPPGACPPVPPGTVLLPRFPHVDRVTKADPPTAPRSPLREEIPPAHQDFRGFTYLTFRVTKNYPVADQPTIDGAARPDFSITFEDASGHRKQIPNSAIVAANPLIVRPIHRMWEEWPGVIRNITKCNLETWRVPLSLFTSAPNAVSLAAIRAVEFEFNALPGEPIYLDTISLVKT